MSQTLWDEALAALPPKVQVALRAARLGKTSHGDTSASPIDGLLNKVQEAHKKCVQKRWKIKRADGSILVIRELLAKILRHIIRFKQIGDIVVQYDPVHAALPWAGVRLIFELAEGDLHYFETITEEIETISSTVSKYTVVESLYLGRGFSIENSLKSAILRVYKLVLQSIATIIEYLESQKIVRIIKGITASTHESSIATIAAANEKVFELTHLATDERQLDATADLAALRARLKEWEQPLSRIDLLEKQYNQQLKREEFEMIATWLSTVPFTQRHSTIMANLVPGTGMWLIEDQEFRRWWEQSISSILLLRGPAGCGKTSLVARIVQWASSACTFSKLAYFYCSKEPSDREYSGTNSILRTLIKQLACTSDCEVDACLYSRYKRISNDNLLFGSDVPQLEVQSCVATLQEMLENFSGFLIIDAIDEVEEHERNELLDILHRIITESSTVVKILITSRVPYPKYTSQNFVISKEKSSDDMAAFIGCEIQRALDKTLLGPLSTTMHGAVIKNLHQKADGMFLWVKLQIDSFRRLQREDELVAWLSHSQTEVGTLTAVYRHTLESVKAKGPRSYSLAQRIFAWLMNARERLSASAVLHSLSTPTTAAVLEATCHLVVHDVHVDQFRFVHATMYEYLSTSLEFTPLVLEHELALVCMATCEASEGMDKFENSMQEITQYSIVYWASHAHAHEHIAKPEEIQYIDEFCFADGEPSLVCLQWLEDAMKTAETLSLGHPMRPILSAISSDKDLSFASCAYGLESVAERIFSAQPSQINTVNQHGQSPLYIASFFGHLNIVRLCLDLGARHDQRGGKYGFPLHAACVGGCAPIVEQLLTAGADYQVTNSLGNALSNALKLGNESAALVFLPRFVLLADQADFETLFTLAAESGMSNVLQRLEALFPTFCAHQPTKTKAAISACRRGQTKAVRRFLESSRPDKEMLEHGLVAASLTGQEETIRLLALHEAPLDVKTSVGSPLMCAALAGHVSTVKLLLQLAESRNITLSINDAACAAARQGHVSVARALIDHERPVDATQLFERMLREATFRGHESIISLLFEHYMYRPRTFQGDFDTILEAAQVAGRYRILQLLLEHAKGPEWSRDEVCQPMFYEMYRSCDPLELLAERGIDVDSDGEDRWMKRSIQRPSWNIASFESYMELAQLAVDSPAEAKNTNPLLVSVLRNDTRMLQMQLQNFGYLGLQFRQIGVALLGCIMHQNLQLMSVILDSSVVDPKVMVSAAMLMSAARGNNAAFQLAARTRKPLCDEDDYFTDASDNSMALLPEEMCSSSTMQLICRSGEAAIVESLLPSDQISSALTRRLVHLACQEDSEAVFLYGLRCRSSEVTRSAIEEWFRIACVNGSTSITKLLFARFQDLIGPNLPYDGFWEACIYCNAQTACSIFLHARRDKLNVSALEAAACMAAVNCSQNTEYSNLLLSLLNLLRHGSSDSDIFTTILDAVSYSKRSLASSKEWLRERYSSIVDLPNFSSYQLDAIFGRFKDYSDQFQDSQMAQIVKILLDLGAEVEGKDSARPPLIAAVEALDIDRIRCLREYGASLRPSARAASVLHQAVSGKKEIQALPALVHDDSSTDDAPSVEAVGLELRVETSVSRRKKTQVLKALFHNDLSTDDAAYVAAVGPELLVETLQGLDVQVAGHGDLSDDARKHVKEGPYSVIKVLLAHGTTLEKGMPSLAVLMLYACFLGDSEIVSILIVLGIDNNTEPPRIIKSRSDGWFGAHPSTSRFFTRPSQAAAAGKHAHILELLFQDALEKRQNLSAIDLVDIIRCQSIDLLSRFLAAGCCPPADNDAMSVAVYEGNVEILLLLSDAGGDLDVDVVPPASEIPRGYDKSMKSLDYSLDSTSESKKYHTIRLDLNTSTIEDAKRSPRGSDDFSPQHETRSSDGSHHSENLSADEETHSKIESFRSENSGPVQETQSDGESVRSEASHPDEAARSDGARASDQSTAPPSADEDEYFLAASAKAASRNEAVAGMPALAWMAETGNTAALELLLARGLSPARLNACLPLALTLAARAAHRATVELLLRHGSALPGISGALARALEGVCQGQRYGRLPWSRYSLPYDAAIPRTLLAAGARLDLRSAAHNALLKSLCADDSKFHGAPECRQLFAELRLVHTDTRCVDAETAARWEQIPRSFEPAD